MSAFSMGFGARVVFAFATFFRLLIDGSFAARLAAAAAGGESEAKSDDREAPALGPPEPSSSPAELPAQTVGAASAIDEAALREQGALLCLGLFQDGGRLIDFLKQEISGFEDADVGSAARVVHEGCRKTLLAHLAIEPIRTEAEGAQVTVPAGFRRSDIKLTGELSGSAPFVGTLRHRGWKANSVKLPTPVGEHDARVLCAAEVEL